MTGFVLVEEAPDVLRPDLLRSRLNTEGCGAVVSFVGLTRETEGEADVLRLEFDAWQDRLTPVLKGLAEQAIQNFGVMAVAMAHRTGSVGPQEPIVAIHVGSPHRKEAFQACEWLIDELKKQAPIWKKEVYLRRGDLEGGVGLSEKSIEGIVNIGSKPSVERRATARGRLSLQASTKTAIVEGDVSKGDVLEASTIAAIQAVKETPRIVPHCHPIPLEGTEVNWRWDDDDLWCTVTVSAHYKTGIEMEALTGVAAGLLCAFDMVKSLEKDSDGQYPTARITDLEVVEKFKGN